MNSDHPSTDELLAFALGLCAPAFVEAIAAHLEVCEHCAEQFDDLATDTDPFVSALRDAFHSARTQETQATPPDSEPGVTGPFDSPGTPEIGSRFGRYEVKGLLGRGQMGAVYRAHDPRLARDIALKVQNCDLSAGPAELSRVENEARSAAQLKHPNIVQVYDQGIHEGRPFCAMELVEGQDLGCYSRERNLSEREIASLLEMLARAVDHAHHCGVIHRDLKPANVMIACGETVRREWRVDPGGSRIENRRRKTGRGEPAAQGSGSGTFAVASTADVPKITDFGLAKRIDVDGTETVAGSILGSPSYMPPEQAQGETSRIGPLSDVFSLGAILYELLTGRPPYVRDGIKQTLDAACRCECEPPSRVRPNVNRDLETICCKCLREEPEERYSSAAALADDLGRFLDDKPILARPVSVWERGVKLVRRHPARVVGSLLLFVCVAALVGSIGVMIHNEIRRELLVALQQKARQLEVALQRIAGDLEDKWVRDLKVAATKERERRKDYAAQLVKCQDRKRRDPDGVRKRLQDATFYPPSLRDFTWRWLSRWCRRRKCSYDPLPGDCNFVQGLAVSGDRFLVGGQDGTVGLYRVGDPKPVWRRQGHEEGKAVTAVCFSPSGDYAVSAGEDGTVRRYELRNGDSRKLVGVDGSCVNDVDIASDGRWLATAHRHDKKDGEDVDDSVGIVRLWDLAGGEPLAESQPVKGSFRCIEFGPDARYLFAGGDYRAGTDGADGKDLGVICVFSIQGGDEGLRTEGPLPDGKGAGPTKSGKIDVALVDRWPGHDRPLTVLAMRERAPEGPYLVSADEKGSVLRWPLSGYALRRPNPTPLRTGGALPVSSLDFSPNGKSLAVAGYDGTVVFVDPASENAASNEVELTLRGDPSFGEVSAVSYVDKNRLIVADKRGRIELYQLSAGEPIELRGHTESITGIAFSGDGRRLVSTSKDRTIRIWPLGDNSPSGAPTVLRPNPKEHWHVEHVAVMKGDRLGDTLVWEHVGKLYVGPLGPAAVDNPSPLKSEFTPLVLDLAATPEGSLLGAIGSDWTGPRLWRLSSKGPQSLDVPNADKLGDCLKLALSKKGNRLAVASRRRVWRWRELGSRHCVSVFEVDSRAVHMLGEYPFVLLESEAKAKLKLESEAETAEESITSLAFSDDARFLAVGTSKGCVIPLNLADMGAYARGAPLRYVKQDSDGEVTSLAFSPDGKTLAGGGIDGKITFWNKWGDQYQWINSRHPRVSDLAFSPDGNMLASGGTDGVIRLWVANQTTDEP